MQGWLFLSPVFIILFFFLFLPVLMTFWLSLWKDVSFLDVRFAGLEHYSRILSDPNFTSSLVFTLAFSLVTVFFEIVTGLMMALTVHENFRGRGILRGLMLLPWAVPSVIGARIWQLIFQMENGLANWILAGLIGIKVNWLGSAGGAFFSIALADIWRTAPFVAIILLAGLQSIPDELYEQARMDGAGLFRRFFSVTLPLLKPMLVIALLFRTIDALRVFDIIYILTGGGPGGSTSSLSFFCYKFFLAGDSGSGMAASVLLFLISFLFALLYLKVSRFRESINE